MQVSIKVVVGVLLFVACAVTMIVAHVPSLIQLQHDALYLAVQESTFSVGLVQHVLQRKIWRVQKSSQDLYRAAKTQNILQDLDSVLNWIGTAVSEQEIGGGLFVSDGTGVYVDSHISALSPIIGANFPGYVYVVNLTYPGRLIDIGLFQLITGKPIVPQQPWFRIPTTLAWTDFPGSADIQNPNRSTPLQWSRLLPFNAELATFASSSPTDSAIFFGGPLDTSGLHSKQHVFFAIRGSWLSSYFKNNVTLSSTGVAILIDSYSGAFVAGNIDDPTGIAVPNGTALMPATQLRDARIEPILSADCPSRGSSGVNALMTCETPCLFIFWHHSNTLQPFADAGYGRVFHVVIYRFTIVQVAEVHHDVGGNLDLRLVVTLPSNDIIGSFIYGLQWSFVVPFCCMMVVCLVVVFGIASGFRGLSEVEAEMQRMMTIFVPSRGSPAAAASATVVSSSQRTTFAIEETSVLEFHRIFIAIRLLSRQLHTLRAFSTASTNDRLSISVGGGGNDDSQADSIALRDSEEGVPYAFRSRKPWSVPVTTVSVLLRGDFTGGLRDDPAAVHARYSAVHGVFQRELSHIAGASMDIFSGDQILIHFNAAGRASHHALIAVCFAHRCLQAVELLQETPLWADAPRTTLPRRPPVYFGVASMLSLCGSLGPRAFRSFTVVSSGEPQAAMMCRVAEKKQLPLCMTWRAVDLVRQQMQNIRIHLFHPQNPYQQVLSDILSSNDINPSSVSRLFDFFPVSQVILAGEPQRQVSMAYAPAW
jgi:hypothetical protein